MAETIRKSIDPRQIAAQAAAMIPLCSVFRRHLRAQSLKYTPERADILNAIIERDGIFEVEELLLEMRTAGHRVSKATIYRTVKLLEEAGIITHALLDSRQAHYRLIYGREPCDYLVCMKTGKYIEFTSDEVVALRDAICRQHGWDPVGHRLQIYGISPEGKAMAERDEEDEK
jgi:Fur family ferric uptake transcriptional regulator